MNLHGIAAIERVEARSEVDVVRNQHRLAVGEFEDEALMAASLIIVGKDAPDHADARHLHVRCPGAEGFGDRMGWIGNRIDRSTLRPRE